MRKILIIGILFSCAWSIKAQEVQNSLTKSEVVDSVVVDDDAVYGTSHGALEPVGFSLPPLTMRGTIAHYPYYNGLMTGFYDWELHPGLNASLSAAAIIGLGHNAGAGFANSMAVAYAGNITPKLSYSIGGYTSFVDYASHVMRDAGLTAMLNYRFNDHWEAAVFAQKSVLKPQVPAHLYYWMDDVGDKIGASVRYNINPSFSIGLSVWRGSTPYQDYYR